MGNEFSLADLLRKCAEALRKEGGAQTFGGAMKSFAPKIPGPKLAVNPSKPMSTLAPAMPGKTTQNPITTRVPTGNQLPGMTAKGMPKEMLA